MVADQSQRPLEVASKVDIVEFAASMHPSGRPLKRVEFQMAVPPTDVAEKLQPWVMDVQFEQPIE